MKSENLTLPENVRRLADNEKFCFSCHPEVTCFTDCCRQLELALSPYDVLRLRKALGKSSAEFLDRYVMVEKTESDCFPQVFLAMNVDEDGNCPFVNENGCSVYQDRPGACRTYPVGRGAYIDDKGQPSELFVLVKEPHCLGFANGPAVSNTDWVIDQELTDYNEFTDLLMTILHHQQIKDGFIPDVQQQERYLNILYNLDDFRRESVENKNLDDLELLKTAVHLIHDELFS